MPKEKPRFWGSLFAIFAKGAKLTKLAKVFSIAKPLLTLATMSISLIVYAFWLGPWLAVIFTALLFIHEMGHVAAMRIKGLGTPSPVFIPFLGAAIFTPKFGDRNEEAFVGYGGPFLGTLASLVVFGFYFLAPPSSTSATILLVGSYFGVYINLFNLLPISPLDGGRVTQAVGGWFKYIGLLLLALLSVALRSPVILLIWVLVLNDLTFISVRLRGVLTPMLAVAMAGLMLMGYGSGQPVWANVLDCVMATAFSVIAMARTLDSELDEPKDTRSSLAFPKRFEWGALYFALVAALVVVIVIQAHYLPHHMPH